MPDLSEFLRQLSIWVIPGIFAITVHEVSHGYVARLFGDRTAEMVADAVERAESTGTKPAIWTQLGVSSQDAQRLADEAGLPYVRNRCIMVEHARLIGR